MTSVRPPGEARAWRSSALALGAGLVPVLALSLFASQEHLLTAAARFTGLIVSPAATVSAIAGYAAWRVNPRPGLAWATIGFGLLSSQELMRAAVELLRFPEPVPGLWVLAADVTSVLVIMISVGAARNVQRRPDPAAMSFALGAVVTGLRLAWLRVDPTIGHQLPRMPVGIVYAAVVLTGAGFLGRGERFSTRIASIPRWVRERTALATVLIGGGHLALYLGDNPTAQAAVVGGGVVGAVLLVSGYVGLLFDEVDVSDRMRADLEDRLVRSQLGVRNYRGTLHEVKSTIAGITSASRLLRSEQGVDEAQKAALEDMLHAELGRLDRLVTTAGTVSAPGPMGPMDVDETIGRIVISHKARGNPILWSPSGLRVMAQPDIVAEVVNILLDNAARHGRPPAEVAVTQAGSLVEIAVSDRGPGIDEHLRARLFEWGARGAGSTGQGIGLHIAHGLAQGQGGFLEVRDTAHEGATFVLGLPGGQADRPGSEACV